MMFHQILGFLLNSNILVSLDGTVILSSSPEHLLAIRGRQKRGPGTLQTRDQNLPK